MVTTTSSSSALAAKKTLELDSVVVRFAGDSGDGIQLTGEQFTNESASIGNDLATLPNFPAEIRAPAGSIGGVSGFQINFGSTAINTPGDTPKVLVAMNPAALKANLRDVQDGGILILNKDSFTAKNLEKVGFSDNPTEGDALEKLEINYKVYIVPITSLTKEALSNTSLSSKEVERCKNFFTLGIMLWMFNRPSESTLNWIQSKFAKKPAIAEANTLALQAGIAYAEATEMFETSYVVKAAELPAGTYRNISGTNATALGLIAASQKSGLPLFLGAYPITPATDILQELAKHKRLDINTFQAEDEIAAICATIGAAYAGNLAITSSSGPGIALKGEALGLAVMTELPIVVINVQRGGPSTGLPTKTEQSDLMQAMYGRHGEAPMCVLAASSPSSAFTMAYEACRLALKYMTPVMLLSDGYITNCSGPWKIVDPAKLPEITNNLITKTNNPEGAYQPYKRDAETMARPWAVPGTPGLEHRIGGLEKEALTGAVNYDGENHELMIKAREAKVAGMVKDIPLLEVDGDTSGELLIVGWGGTEGTLIEAVRQAKQQGIKVSRIHLHYINPFPANLGEILKSFKKVLVPEINRGQLIRMIRDQYLVDAQGLNVTTGQPLRVTTVLEQVKSMLAA